MTGIDQTKDRGLEDDIASIYLYIIGSEGVVWACITSGGIKHLIAANLVHIGYSFNYCSYYSQGWMGRLHVVICCVSFSNSGDSWIQGFYSLSCKLRQELIPCKIIWIFDHKHGDQDHFYLSAKTMLIMFCFSLSPPPWDNTSVIICRWQHLIPQHPYQGKSIWAIIFCIPRPVILDIHVMKTWTKYQTNKYWRQMTMFGPTSKCICNLYETRSPCVVWKFL